MKNKQKVTIEYTGFSVAGVPRKQVEEILHKIYLKHGKLDGNIVLTEASRKTHPFYQHFFKDSDKVAAMKHRLQLARDLIRHVHIVIKEEQNGKVQESKIRAYQNVMKNEEGALTLNSAEAVESYHLRIDDIANDNELMQYQFERAKKDMLQFKNKYYHLNEVKEVIDAIEKLLNPSKLSKIKMANAA